MSKNYLNTGILISILSILPLQINSSDIKNENAQQTDSCQIPLNENWQPETYSDSQGIYHAEYDNTTNQLILSARLIGKDPHFSKGEAFLDLRWIELSCLDNLRQGDFLNLSNKKLIVKMIIPQSFIGYSNSPNGIQLFAKSGDNFDGAYSVWKSIDKAGEVTIEFNFSGPYGFKKPGYNANNIVSIGIKAAINSNSTFKFEGKLIVKSILIK